MICFVCIGAVVPVCLGVIRAVLGLILVFKLRVRFINGLGNVQLIFI